MQQYTCQSFVLKLIKDSYFGSVLLLTHYNVTSVIKLTQFIDILSVAAQCIKTKQYKNRTNRSSDSDTSGLKGRSSQLTGDPMDPHHWLRRQPARAQVCGMSSA